MHVRSLKGLLLPLIVVIAALVPRLFLLQETENSGLYADMAEYFAKGEHLYRTGVLFPDAFRVPGYTIALALAFAVLGPSPHTAHVLQLLILVSCALATYYLAKKSVSRGRALAAGLVVAVYPGLLLYTAYVMGEPLFALLSVVTLLAVARFDWTGSLIGGLTAGLAVISRQAGAALVVAVGTWLVSKALWSARLGRPLSWRRAIPPVVVFVLGVACVATPWVVRNYRLFGRFMPLESSGGIIFLMSNYEDATGRYVLSDFDTVHIRYLNGLPDEFVRNTEGYRRGVRYILEHPRHFAALVPRRLGYFLDVEGREHTWLYTSNFFGPRSPLTVAAWGWALLLSFPVLVTGAILGVGFGPPLAPSEHAILGVLGLITCQQTLVYGDPRFHLPLIPLVAVLAVRPWTLQRASALRLATAGVLLGLCVIWWGVRLMDHLPALSAAAVPGGQDARLPY